MKISRLHIDQFAIDDYPEIAKDDIVGETLLLKGGNRSGKTLTVNALLYGLYGPKGTFSVSPGRQSSVQIHFDNGHHLDRGSGGREYADTEETYEKDTVETRIQEIVGAENLVKLQFVHSETDKLPLARLTTEELLTRIRRLKSSTLQNEIEELTKEREELELEIEQVTRTELNPRQRELEEIDVGRYERRLEKIEHLQDLIETGRIQTIKQRLLDNEELNDQLEDLYKRKRTIEQDLRKKKRQLREEQRYTNQVNDIILEAIDELVCPVCDHVVEEDLAQRRLRNGQCPHCARERSLDDLKSDLREKVETADDTIESLEREIEALQDEKSEIEAEIESIQSSVPDLSDLNDLTRYTLEENDYDLEAVAVETEKQLAQHRDEVDHLTEKKDQLENEIESSEATLTELEDSHEAITQEISELQEESFEEVITDFQEDWSTNYQGLAGDLGQEIRIESDGSVQLPGNEGPRSYTQLSTGERRLLNIAFAYTIAQTSTDTEDNFDVVVLDEPFANLEPDNRESAIEFIHNSDLQFLITTSNEEIQSYFDASQIEPLQTMPIQLTWEDYE
ncbi:SbcC/MukB-like Walker B domain-containing protein [Halomicrococcus sp. NG-SE-24]|uniref:ATP-binding cassette domain-containing protein n=1 Tax=Halomicrococcus sp. NG-SE-24 TaxID=3436928 RepID=UPI003D960782